MRFVPMNCRIMPAQDQRAFLLVVDPRTLKPEDFCFVDGAMPGDLRITETGELCWSVKPIISVCISEVGVDFVTRLTEYTFDENMVYQGRRHGYTEVLWPYIGQGDEARQSYGVYIGQFCCYGVWYADLGRTEYGRLSCPQDVFRRFGCVCRRGVYIERAARIGRK